MTPEPNRSARRALRRPLLAVLGLVLTLAAAAPAWLEARASSNPAARFDVRVPAVAAHFEIIDTEWMDARRGRRVPVRLFWPDAAAAKPVPLVVFSPGIGSSRDGYDYLGRYWAAHGIASIHLQHVGSDRSLWKGNVFTVVSRFRQATGEVEAIARVHDARFALDALLSSRRGNQVDRSRIVAAGHSYGANTTLLEAGARVVRHGQALDLRDSRIRAAILIAAPPFYGDRDMVPILSGIHIPTLHISTMEDVIRLPGFGSGVQDRLEVFDAIGGQKVLAVYRRGSHNVFTDRLHFDSIEVARQVKSGTEALSLAFMQQVFGTPEPLDDWGRHHASLVAKYVVER